MTIAGGNYQAHAQDFDNLPLETGTCRYSVSLGCSCCRQALHVDTDEESMPAQAGANWWRQCTHCSAIETEI